MSRTMRAPGIWSDDGPSIARTYSAGYIIRQANVVGAMVPPPFTAHLVTPSERERIERRRETNREYNRVWRERHKAPGRGHQGVRYPTDEERAEARRATWRASKERERRG